MRGKIKVKKYEVLEDDILIYFDNFDYTIKQKDFEKWCKQNDILKGSKEMPCVDNTGQPSYKTVSWDDTFDEVLENAGSFKLIELLETYFNDIVKVEYVNIKHNLSAIKLNCELIINAINMIEETQQRKKEIPESTEIWDNMILIYVTMFLKYKNQWN